MGLTFFADRGNLPRKPLRAAVLLVGIGVVFALIASSLTTTNVLAAALLLALLATGLRGTAADAYRLASLAVTVLKIYVVVRTSIPYVWLTADRAGEALGGIVGFLTHRLLRAGATFGGIDFLVLTTATSSAS